MNNNSKEYIITYNNYYKENCLLELDCVKDGEYVTKCGYSIPTNHLFTKKVVLTDKERIELLSKHGILNGNELSYYKQSETK